MRRLLRLLILCLLALALPLQGASAAAALAGSHAHAPAHPPMVMPDGTVMDAATMSGTAADDAPCPHHAVDKIGCGACCGPAVAQQQPLLAVAPAAVRWSPAVHVSARAAAPVFLTGGPDRPPRLA